MFDLQSHRCVRLFLLVLLLLRSRPALAGNSELIPLEFPQTVKVEASLKSKVGEMLAMSPAFREQCLRLDQADNLVVLLRVNPLLPTTEFLARSTLRRYTSGMVLVDVEVAVGAGQAEWIAHEFEHILETIEGRSLSGLEREKAPGVWQSVDGMIETSRATEAGRRVLSEMLSVDLPDKSVE